MSKPIDGMYLFISFCMGGQEGLCCRDVDDGLLKKFNFSVELLLV